jgi:hypothetical protein
VDENHEVRFPAPLSDRYLLVIGYALFPYAQMIHRTVAPSPQRNETLKTMEAIRQRISAVKIPTQEDQQFFLSHDELHIIDKALMLLIDNIAQFIAASQEREEIQQACRALRSYLQGVFSPLDASVTEEE